MTPAGRSLLFWGALSAAVAVAAGAFGAHALRARLDPGDLAVFETGARYQMYHALGTILAAQLAASAGSRAVWAGRLFLIGTVLFSGSLYGLTLSGQRWLGAVTPLGGVAFLLGWLLIAASAGTREAAPRA